MEISTFFKGAFVNYDGLLIICGIREWGWEKPPTDGSFLYLFAHLVAFFFCEKNIDIGILIDQALGYI